MLLVRFLSWGRVKGGQLTFLPSKTPSSAARAGVRPLSETRGEAWAIVRLRPGAVPAPREAGRPERAVASRVRHAARRDLGPGLRRGDESQAARVSRKSARTLGSRLRFRGGRLCAGTTGWQFPR